MSKHTRPEADTRIPESAAQQLERLLPESAFFRNCFATHRNATADIVVELMRGMLAAHPEEIVNAMDKMQELRVPTGDPATDEERVALIELLQGKMGAAPAAAAGKKKR